MRFHVISRGNSCDPEDFGGTPHRLIRALRDTGEDATGVDMRRPLLEPPAKALWTAASLARRRTLPRGWQYTRTAQLLRDATRARTSGADRFVSLYQLPPSVVLDSCIFVIDGTLTQLFEDYHELRDVPARIREAAVERERRNYMASRAVMAKTAKTLDYLRGRYEIPPEKLTRTYPVPNLDAQLLRKPVASACYSSESELKFVTTGKDFHRKGIDRCIRIVQALRDNGVRARLDVIGIAGSDAPTTWRLPWITYHGLVSKSQSPGKYERLLSMSDIGLILSRSELAGLASVEYQAAGLLVIGSGVGGMVSTQFTSSVVWLRDSDDTAAVCDQLLTWVRSGELAKKLEAAGNERHLVPTWDLVAHQIRDLSYK